MDAFLEGGNALLQKDESETANLFTQEQLKNAFCSPEEMALAKKYGSEFTHEEFGKKLTAYLYQESVFVVDIVDIK